MPNLIIAITILMLGWYGLKFFSRAPPRLLARVVRLGGGGIVGLVGVLLLLRGRLDLGIAGIGAGLFLAGFSRLPGKSRFSWPGRKAAGRSQVRSAAIAMELDHVTGAIGGSVIAGPHSGRRLDDLTRTECEQLHAWCARDDLDGARLLQPYLDRRFPGWREASETQGDARSGSGGRGGSALSEEQAYKVLGLGKGASRDDIVRAHRTLMKKFHPDHGGTTDFAARVNEAKEVLLRRID